MLLIEPDAPSHILDALPKKRTEVPQHGERGLGRVALSASYRNSPDSLFGASGLPTAGLLPIEGRLEAPENPREVQARSRAGRREAGAQRVQVE
jgi:hypothetical protein